MSHPLVLRMVSALARDAAPVEEACSSLTDAFGPVALRSGRYPFDMSGYYSDEMGEGLSRTWLAFGCLARPELIAEWKLECARIEDRLRSGGCRSVNLDPGYLDFGKLVLASFKEAPDKLYVGSGVWAHTCLRYRHGGFEAPDHSFPDFRDGRFSGFMLEARRFYASARRAGPDGPARDTGPGCPSSF